MKGEMNRNTNLIWRDIMWKSVMVSLALVALSGLAVAADISDPVDKAPKSHASEWNWTGCYIGGHAGGMRAKSKNWTVLTPGGDFYGQSLGSHDADGWLGGAQAGCNYQFAGRFVIGIQGDYAFANAKGSHDSAQEFGVVYDGKVKSLAAVTGRLGYAFDRVLGYVRGGAAWERVNYGATTIILGKAYAARVTRPGWTIGAGVEYAFTRSLSGFAEYNYYNFGTSDITLSPQVSGLRIAHVGITETTNSLRIGINYRF